MRTDGSYPFGEGSILSVGTKNKKSIFILDVIQGDQYMAERDFVIIAREVGSDSTTNQVEYEAFKKVVAMNPVMILSSLNTTYPTGPAVKDLFERGETENVERFIGKNTLIENAENFRMNSIYIFGVNGKPEWLHLYVADKKLRNINECKKDFKF